MNQRSFAVWCSFVPTAIINGGLRDSLLTPSLGERSGHVISTITLCTAILVITWLMIGWMRLGSSRDASLLGVEWVLLTGTFEFLAGHYFFGTSWNKLLSEYDLSRGRVWILVLAATAFAPCLAARLHGISAASR